MIIADTSGLLALFNDREPSHETVAGLVDGLHDPLVVSPFVLAEVDYLVATRLGVAAELAVLDELGGGAYVLPAMDTDHLAAARRVIERYAEHEIGVADASIVVLAEQFSTRRLLTLDHRHFRVVRPLQGGTFDLLPAT